MLMGQMIRGEHGSNNANGDGTVDTEEIQVRIWNGLLMFVSDVLRCRL